MTKKKKIGRPKIMVDYANVEKLATIGCTHEEIAAYLDLSVAKLEHDPEFIQAHKKGMEKCKMSLRRMQFQAANGGNVTMQIWLGKQYLGQKDQAKQEITGTDGKPIKIEWVEVK